VLDFENLELSGLLHTTPFIYKPSLQHRIARGRLSAIIAIKA
jgi:hypothetical protein